MNWIVTSLHRFGRGLGVGAAGLVLAALPGCGGGVYVELPFDGPPPEVSLATAPSAGYRGDPVQLVAAVSASNGIDYVDFYRIDFGSSTPLGRVWNSPYRLNTSIPFSAGSSVSYFVSACDGAGFCTSSAAVTVDVFR